MTDTMNGTLSKTNTGFEPNESPTVGIVALSEADMQMPPTLVHWVEF